MYQELGAYRYREPLRASPNQSPFRLTLMRGLTVLTFACILLNVTSWGTRGTDRPELPESSIVQANQMLDRVLGRARLAGSTYTLEYGAGDFYNLSALSSALQDFAGGGVTDRDGPASTLALVRKVRYVRDEISSSALYNSGVKEGGAMVGPYYVGNVVEKYRKAYGEAPRPVFLPPAPASSNVNWREVAVDGIHGWLLAMIPAFLTILVSFRLRRESLWAELVERPLWPVLATVFWPIGLWGYVGQPGVIERKLQRFVRDFRQTNDTEPDPAWVAAQRLVLMRRAHNAQEALLAIREYPELLAVNSRRAIFTGWLITLLSGPVQMVLGVVQAYAQIARASGGTDSAQVDSSRVQRRKFSGFVDGNVETSSDGRRLETSGHVRGKLVYGDEGLFLHVDARTLKPLEAYATTQLGRTKLMTGMVVPYPVFDYPAPWDALFRSSPGFDLLPSFADFGIQTETRAGPATLQAGVLTGDGVGGGRDDRHDLVLRLSGGHGPLSGAVSYQGGDDHDYSGANVTLKGDLGSIGYEYARRTDRDPSRAGTLHQLEVIGQRGQWRAGAQLAQSERRTLLGVVERKLGGFKRIMLECLLRKGGAPTWTLRIQQGLKLATP